MQEGISVFDVLFGNNGFSDYDSYVRPKCRTKKGEDLSLEVAVELAGINPDTVQLDVIEDNNTLLLTYLEPELEKKSKWTLLLPRGYAASAAKASIKHGLLKLHWKRDPVKHKQLEITKED